MSTNPATTVSLRISPKTTCCFHEGTPVFPQCGFSAAVVQVLSELGVKSNRWTC